MCFPAGFQSEMCSVGLKLWLRAELGALMPTQAFCPSESPGLLIYSDGLIFSHRKYATRTEGLRCLCVVERRCLYASWSVWHNGRWIAEKTLAINSANNLYFALFLLKIVHWKKRNWCRKNFHSEIDSKFHKIVTKNVKFWNGIYL